jgi:hypothetical protein
MQVGSWIQEQQASPRVRGKPGSSVQIAFILLPCPNLVVPNLEVLPHYNLVYL